MDLAPFDHPPVPGRLARAAAARLGGRPWQEMEDGALALRHGDHARAIQLFTRALGSGQLSDIERASVLFQRSQAHEESRQVKEALEDMRRYVKLIPDDPDGEERLARLKKLRAMQKAE